MFSLAQPVRTVCRIHLHTGFSFFLSFFHSFIYLFYLFIYLFIYLFMAVLGLRLCARAFSSCGKWGPLFIAVRGPLTIAASLVAEHRLQTRRLSNCGSRAQLLRGMWDPLRPALEPVSPASADRLSTTAPPGKPHTGFSYGKMLPSHMLSSMSKERVFFPVILLQEQVKLFLRSFCMSLLISYQHKQVYYVLPEPVPGARGMPCADQLRPGFQYQ